MVQWAHYTNIKVWRKKWSNHDHRGICVSSCLGKLFCSILNQRLMEHVNSLIILHNSQIGFLPKTEQQTTFSRGGSRNFRKRTPSPPPSPSPSPSVRWKLHFSGNAAYSIVGVIVMYSKVNISEDRIKEHLIKRFSGRLEGLGSYRQTDRQTCFFWGVLYKESTLTTIPNR